MPATQLNELKAVLAKADAQEKRPVVLSTGASPGYTVPRMHRRSLSFRVQSQ
jgi:hypothetical protein